MKDSKTYTDSVRTHLKSTTDYKRWTDASSGTVGILLAYDQIDGLSAGRVTTYNSYDSKDRLILSTSFNGEITEYEIHPEDFGLTMTSNRAFKVETAQESMAMLRGVLDNQSGPAKDIVALNAGVALYAANVAPTMADGLALARSAIESGAAKAKMLALVELSKSLAA